MAGVFTDEGLVDEMTSIKNAATWRVLLFKTDFTPSASTVIADVTGANECGFAGYARVTPAWGTPAMTGAGLVASMTSGACTFTRSTTGTTENAYGWGLINTGTNKLVYAERFSDAPKAFTNAGDFRTVTPTHTHDQA